MSKPVGRNAASSIAYRVCIGVTILWMAVFYPAVCEYHGLMLFKPPMSREVSKRVAEDLHAHRNAMDMTSPAHDSMVAAAPLPTIVTLAPTLQHQTYPVSATMLSMLAISTGWVTILKLSPRLILRVVNVLPFDHQHYPTPPTRPPRLSLV